MRRLFGLAATAGGLAAAAALSEPTHAQNTQPLRGTAVVTGGSRGIGAATCTQLASKGFDVVVVYQSDLASASKVVTDIEICGGRAVAIQADVSDEQQVVSLFKQVDSWRGKSPLKALVNSAGVLGPRDELKSLSAGAIMDVLKVNVIGPALCIREAEQRMSTKEGQAGGAIVQISSGSAYIGSPLAYGCSKGALNSLTIGLVSSLARQGIRINTVSPGMTDTDMISETKKSFDLTQIPLGRVGKPEEIGRTVVWLCCEEESSYVAGANVRVAGGRPPGTTLG